jgi:hypothetical protein
MRFEKLPNLFADIVPSVGRCVLHSLLLHFS